MIKVKSRQGVAVAFWTLFGSVFLYTNMQKFA